MSLRPAIVILILLLLFGWLPGSAYALLDGEVQGTLLYGTAQYRAEVDGQEAQKITTTYEQVALRYAVNGLLGDARMGKYTLMLGYEFSILDPSVSSYGIKDPEVEKITAKKPYYEGSFVLAPGGLPFRLSAYARDLHQTAFTSNSTRSLPVGLQGQDRPSLIEPDIFTGIENGTHRELGVTLLVGIRNGSYLGAYRDLLSQLPRLLIDYKQMEIRDLSHDFNMVNTRSRDLAFVSLNKKDNWIHLRRRDFVDYIRPHNNATQSQVLLGSIDHMLQRKWINLTNWIKISGDLSYNTETTIKLPDPERSYQLNMMAISQRENMSTSVYSQFNRLNDGRFLDLHAELPIIVSVDFSRDTQLRSRFIYEANERSFLDGVTESSTDDNGVFTGVEESSRDCYLDTQLELRRSRRVISKSRFELEFLENSTTQDGLAVKASSEIRSNSHLYSAFNWLGGYALTATRTSDTALDESKSYLQNELYGRVDKDVSRSLRIGGAGSLAIGSGKGRGLLTFRIPVLSGKLQTGNGNGSEVDSSSDDSAITSGLLDLYLDHRYRQLGNRLSADYNFISTAGITKSQISLRHTLDYGVLNHKLGWSSSVNMGDNSGAPASLTFGFAGESNTTRTSKISWDSRANYSYSPNRSTALTLLGAISSGAQTLSYTFSEKLLYRLFTSNGIVRRVAEFSEELGYEKVGVTADVRGDTVYGRFSAAYFPTKYLYGKLRSEIGGFMKSSALQQVHIGEVGFDFEKLKLLASYSQGQKSRESESLPEVNEQRWELQVKKIF